MLQRAGVEPGMKVLDAGCGPGRLTIPLARKVGKTGSVLALDAQASMLTKLKAKLEAQGLHNVRMMHAALGTGALGPERFDRAFLVTVLGEIPDQAGALGEIYEHLCPGGILTVCEVLPDPHYQRQAVVRRLAERAGFTVEIAYQNYRSYTMNLKRPAPPGETVSR